MVQLNTVQICDFLRGVNSTPACVLPHAHFSGKSLKFLGGCQTTETANQASAQASIQEDIARAGRLTRYSTATSSPALAVAFGITVAQASGQGSAVGRYAEPVRVVGGENV
jgi:hypothetical protein